MSLSVCIASVSARRPSGTIESLVALYIKRLQPFAKARAEHFASESALLEAARREHSRVPVLLMLLDSRGRMYASEEFAASIGAERDGGRQSMIFGIGPADGWSAAAMAGADRLLSLGPMTLPHELARLVTAEQVYRAFTILEGHPYHSGH